MNSVVFDVPQEMLQTTHHLRGTAHSGCVPASSQQVNDHSVGRPPSLM